MGTTMGRPLRIEYPDAFCHITARGNERQNIIKQASKALNEDASLLKRVQIYLCHKFSGQKLKEIGLHFGIGVSGVSQASRRVALQIKDDKKLKKKIDKIILDLDLSIV
ncbi:MAG: hypothetical protein U9R17_03780 [Thermodesulfobacteriota bacterium]|nr:hypothetical protein [Thermodesulfobacteriota bacterium]